MSTTRIISAEDRLAAANLRRIWNERHRRLGLTQEKAAAHLGFAGQSAVSQYLNARIPLNTDAILRFARLLEVSPADIDARLASLLPDAAVVNEARADYNGLTSDQRELLVLFAGLTFEQQRAILAQLREQNRANDQLLRQLLARGHKAREHSK